MTGIANYRAIEQATLPLGNPLAGVDWCWTTTTNHVETNVPVVLSFRRPEALPTRVARGVQFAFSNYETLLKRLAD